MIHHCHCSTCLIAPAHQLELGLHALNLLGDTVSLIQDAPGGRAAVQRGDPVMHRVHLEVLAVGRLPDLVGFDIGGQLDGRALHRCERSATCSLVIAKSLILRNAYHAFSGLLAPPEK